MQTIAEHATFELDGERYVVPDFAGRGLANVAPTVLRLLAPDAAVELPPLAEDVLPARLSTEVTTVIVLVADGFGHLQLERAVAAGHAPYLTGLLQRARAGAPDVAYSSLTSVFPTTTVAALGSVNSAVAPAEHGLLGYTLYLPDFEMPAEMIRWGPLDRRISFADPEFGAMPERFFWAPTTYARLRAAGVDRAFAVNPGHFVNTALTRMLHQQASYAGYISTSSLRPIVERLHADSRAPTYIYAYWPTIDTIAHHVGPLTVEHDAEINALDFQLGQLLAQLPRRDDTLLLLTADHGHIDTGPESSVSLGDHPELLRMLAVLPVGERRAVYLHPRPGAAEEVLGYARERLRDVAVPLTRDAAVELGLFGPRPLSSRAAGRIGEVLLFPRRNLQLTPPAEMPDGTQWPTGPSFRGLHGGLSAEEALVPLLAIRL